MLTEIPHYAEEIIDPTNPPRLQDHEIHIWKFSLDRPEEQWQALYPLLNSDEAERANRFRFNIHRRRYIVGRGMMRVLLGSYLNSDPAEIPLTTGPSGKPMLNRRMERSYLQFNLAHSNDVALFAIGMEAGVGVDIEHIAPIPEADDLAKRFFSPLEYRLLQMFPKETRLRTFYTIWVLNESCLKASGDGLSTPLDQIEVAPTAAQLLSISFKDDVRRPALEWQLQLFTPESGYIAALAVEERKGQFVTRFLTDGSCEHYLDYSSS